MYKVIWVYKRNTTDSIFFYDSELSTAYRAALTKLENEPFSLMVDRQIVSTDQYCFDSVTFSSKETYKNWMTKFLEEAPNGIADRNKYVLDNGQMLIIRIINEDGSTSTNGIVPFDATE